MKTIYLSVTVIALERDIEKAKWLNRLVDVAKLTAQKEKVETREQTRVNRVIY